MKTDVARRRLVIFEPDVWAVVLSILAAILVTHLARELAPITVVDYVVDLIARTSAR